MSDSKPLPLKKRVFINSPPSGCPHLLAKAIEIWGYEDYAISNNYVAGTPKSFNYKQSKNSLEQLQTSTSSQKNNEKIGLGGLSPYFVDSSIVKYWLDRVANGQYILGHIPRSPALTKVLAELDYIHLLVMSNPQSLVVSMLSFILDEKRAVKHFLQDDFKLMSPRERLSFILSGGYASKAGVEVESFAEIYRSMLTWNQEPSCFLVSLEDLICQPGGATLEKQKGVMTEIANYLGEPLYEDMVERLREIEVSTASVFKIGAWQNLIDPEISDRLVEYCEPLCEETGYNI